MEPEKTTLPQNPYESPKGSDPCRPCRRYGAVTLISFLLPFAVPFMCNVAYEPINHEWTVKKFGCGCPSLDGKRHFNANDFNAILWGGILIGCVSWWIPAARRLLPENIKTPACIFGAFIITWICLRIWLRGIWL